MSASMKLTGLGELRGKLEALGAIGARKAMQSAARKAMAPVVETARQMAPKAAGTLAGGIRLAAVRPKSGDVVVSVGVTVSPETLKSEVKFEDGSSYTKKTRRNADFRWHFAEFGTKHHPAHPYLRPAFQQHVGGIVAGLAEALRKAIHREAMSQVRAARKAGG
jgi:HK97 gp10 family phage protein